MRCRIASAAAHDRFDSGVGTSSEMMRCRTPHNCATSQGERLRIERILIIRKEGLTALQKKQYSIGVDEEASVVCISDRAKNGFGAMDRGHVMYLHGIPSERISDWNKLCAHKRFMS